jgi:D-glycero-D-manno-heptose 1,7-bisphosphate phosphatase
MEAEGRNARLYIFDADGTLRRTRIPGQPCPRAPDEWELLPGVADAMHRLVGEHPDILLGVASNQDQVGYGLISYEMAHRLLTEMIVAASGLTPPREVIVLCPHPVEAACRCRKPQPAMLVRIMRYYGVRPPETVFVGDSPVDREAARRAGVAFQWAHVLFDHREDQR